MKREEIKQIAKKGILTIDEIKLILNYLVYEVRKNLNINDASTRLCKESSMYLLYLCDDINIPYIPIANNELLMPSLEHHFGITGFNTSEGQLCFLLDLTYIQFTQKYYSVNNKNILSPGNFISDESKKELVSLGYLTLTEKNLEDYLNSFIESYRQIFNVNSKFIYDKLYKLFNKFNINIINENKRFSLSL